MKSSVSCCDADDFFSRMVLRPFAILALFVVAKVQEKLEKFGKGELDVVRGALIPLAVLGLVYRYGARPMIGGARRRRWAIMPDVSSRKLTMSTFEMLLVT